jgi:ribulose-phosphate 3-epimerase
MDGHFVPNISIGPQVVKAIRKMIDKQGLDVDLEVDGGIDRETAPQVIAAGADALVAGTATFRGGPSAYAANIAALRGG